MIILLLYGLSLFRTTVVTGAGYDKGYMINMKAAADKVKKNIDHIRAELPALRWMGCRVQPPTCRDQTLLEGGIRLGIFWNNCKHRKRCARSPYDRLLVNPVLKVDYRYSLSVTRDVVRTRRNQRILLPKRMWTTYRPSRPL